MKLMNVLDAIEAAAGQRVHPSTAWRWTQRGSRGRVLRTWLLGGRRMTTLEAVREFLESRGTAAAATRGKSKARLALESEL